jgi:PAS domain S-box-containing protein
MADAEVSYAPDVGEDGEVRGIVAVMRDVTAANAERAALLRSQARLSALLDSAEDFAVMGLNDEGIVTDLSRGGERVLGWKEEELVGHHVREIYTQEDQLAQRPERELRNAREHGRSQNERWHRRKDGAVFWSSGFGYPLEGGGFVKVFQDRTAEVQAEAALERKVAERTEELSAANAEMETFNYSVSHDLRAPLRAIAMTSAVLLEEAGEEIAAEHRELLERQGHAARRLGVLIDELLRMSRLNREEMRREPVDLSGLAKDVVSETDGPCSVNPVRVEVHPSMAAHGDPKLLRLVLMNLLENACKFSPNGGTIEVGETEADGERAIYVRDQGVGFDMAYAEKLFLPFERLVRDDEFPGTGIGLANVQRIVQRHGGRVWAESEPGRGATFFFTLG